MPHLLAILAAALPTALYTLLIWWLDRYEKEPLPLLAAAFCWGMLPAIGLALVSDNLLGLPPVASPLGPSLGSGMLAPLIEEPIKAIALLALFHYARDEFDGPLDGIVYGALVGFGFSMSENLLFFLAYPEDLPALFWLRSVAFGLNHAFFTSIVGLALGAVRYHRGPVPVLLATPCALSAAITFHALHNVAADYRLPGLALSWIIQSLGVLVVFAVAVLSWRHEARLIDEELGEEIRLGVIGTADQCVVASARARARCELNALLQSGLPRYRQISRLHHLITELAFCKHLISMGDPHANCALRDTLRQQIITLRADIADEEDAPLMA
ncbi:MAG: PrsW family intramembrane metalloprotease [Oscillochloris sp.]|nr:PrsW family intramembrane metalloprotease [Oscillochloris sp.]